MSKLELNMQQAVKTVVWRYGAPLHLEEAGIEDARKISIDWLIDIEELENIESDNKSVTMDDASVISFSKAQFILRIITILTILSM